MDIQSTVGWAGHGVEFDEQVDEMQALGRNRLAASRRQICLEGDALCLGHNIVGFVVDGCHE